MYLYAKDGICIPQKSVKINLPKFDMHKVEESLKINHKVFEGRPLSDHEIKEGVQMYLQFLKNHKIMGSPERFEVPIKLIDRVWHTHMCETEQYRKDCIKYFGKIIEHRSEICDGGLDD